MSSPSMLLLMVCILSAARAVRDCSPNLLDLEEDLDGATDENDNPLGESRRGPREAVLDPEPLASPGKHHDALSASVQSELPPWVKTGPRGEPLLDLKRAKRLKELQEVMRKAKEAAAVGRTVVMERARHWGFMPPAGPRSRYLAVASQNGVVWSPRGKANVDLHFQLNIVGAVLDDDGESMMASPVELDIYPAVKVADFQVDYFAYFTGDRIAEVVMNGDVYSIERYSSEGSKKSKRIKWRKGRSKPQNDDFWIKVSISRATRGVFVQPDGKRGERYVMLESFRIRGYEQGVGWKMYRGNETGMIVLDGRSRDGGDHYDFWPSEDHNQQVLAQIGKNERWLSRNPTWSSKNSFKLAEITHTWATARANSDPEELWPRWDVQVNSGGCLELVMCMLFAMGLREDLPKVST